MSVWFAASSVNEYCSASFWLKYRICFKSDGAFAPAETKPKRVGSSCGRLRAESRTCFDHERVGLPLKFSLDGCTVAVGAAVEESAIEEVRHGLLDRDNLRSARGDCNAQQWAEPTQRAAPAPREIEGRGRSWAVRRRSLPSGRDRPNRPHGMDGTSGSSLHPRKIDRCVGKRTDTAHP